VSFYFFRKVYATALNGSPFSNVSVIYDPYRFMNYDGPLANASLTTWMAPCGWARPIHSNAFALHSCDVFRANA